MDNRPLNIKSSKKVFEMFQPLHYLLTKVIYLLENTLGLSSSQNLISLELRSEY